MLVLDSGAVSRLAERSSRAAALIAALRRQELWPPVVPSVVLVECLTGHVGGDAGVNRLLKACDVATGLPVARARRAAALRAGAGRGSVVDAVVIATAEPGGTVLSGDPADLGALAAHTDAVRIERV